MSKTIHYPDPQPVNVFPPTFHQRYRVTIPCFDQEQADRIAEQVSEFCSCDKELFVGITNRDATIAAGEVVLMRELVPLRVRVPAEAPSTA